jgi:hypothetical protein
MKKALIVIVFLSLTSCSLVLPSIVLKRNGIFDEKSKLKVISDEKQKILFLGMHHVGKKEFYDDVAIKIDSLQKLDYTVFYENVADKKEIDSLVTIKSALKLRKLMGFLAVKHLDTSTNIISNKIRYIGRHKLMNQPNESKLNIDTLTAIRADVGLTELIAEFEKKYLEIKLDSCDYKTSLKNNKYKCKKVKRKLAKKFRHEFIGKYRNKSLYNKIINSKKKKIVVVYGSSHYMGLIIEYYLAKKKKINDKKLL